MAYSEAMRRAQAEYRRKSVKQISVRLFDYQSDRHCAKTQDGLYLSRGLLDDESLPLGVHASISPLARDSNRHSLDPVAVAWEHDERLVDSDGRQGAREAEVHPEVDSVQAAHVDAGRKLLVVLDEELADVEDSSGDVLANVFRAHVGPLSSFGRGGGTRTRTGECPRAPEARASANSATPRNGVN